MNKQRKEKKGREQAPGYIRRVQTQWEQAQFRAQMQKRKKSRVEP